MRNTIRKQKSVHHMTLQKSLIVAFIMMSFIVLVVAGVGWISTVRLGQHIDTLGRNDLPSVEGLWKLYEGQTEIKALELMLLNPKLNQAQRQSEWANTQAIKEQINAGLQEYEKTPFTGDEEKLYQKMRHDWEKSNLLHQEFLRANQEFEKLGLLNPFEVQFQLISQHQGNLLKMSAAKAATALWNKLNEQALANLVAFKATEKSILKLIEYNREEAVDTVNTAEGDLSHAQWWAIVGITIGPLTAMILGTALSMAITKRQTQAFEQIREQSERLHQALVELQNTQAQLIQTEKMSSLGQMVAGVAHEINNPVNFIYGNLTHANEYIKDLLRLLDLYQQQYPHPATIIQDEVAAVDLEFLKDDLPRLLTSMWVGSQRISEIVKSLRVFSRLDEAEFKVVDLHEGIDSTLMILGHRLKDKLENSEIQVTKHYDSLPLVECYPGQLNQVFMNLLCNAIDALEERDRLRSREEIDANPSTITISTEQTTNDLVVIRIADNGLGIPEANYAKLFDPFFTTKAVGKGTGLGLSISYQIVVNKHGGQLLCHSTLGQGAEFVVQIPLHQKIGKLV